MVTEHLQSKQDTWKHRQTNTNMKEGYVFNVGIDIHIVAADSLLVWFINYLRSQQHRPCCRIRPEWTLLSLPPKEDRPLRWAERRLTAHRWTRVHPAVSPDWCLSRERTPCWSRGANHLHGAEVTGQVGAILHTGMPAGHSHRSTMDGQWFP